MLGVLYFKFDEFGAVVALDVRLLACLRTAIVLIRDRGRDGAAGLPPLEKFVRKI